MGILGNHTGMQGQVECQTQSGNSFLDHNACSWPFTDGLARLITPQQLRDSRTELASLD